MPSVRTTTRVPTAFCAVPTGCPCAPAERGPPTSASTATTPAVTRPPRIALMARSVAVEHDADRLAPDRHGGEHRAAAGVDDLEVVRDLVDHEEARAFPVARDPVGTLPDVDLLEDAHVGRIRVQHDHPVQARDRHVGVRTLQALEAE